MANRKARLSVPSASTAGMNHKVRFDFGSKLFVVTNKGKKTLGMPTFKNHGLALEHATGLEDGTIKRR